MGQRTAVVSGVITDAITHARVAGAEVILEISSDVFRATTSADGSWMIGELPAGTGHFTVQKIGYVEINSVDFTARAQVEVALKSGSEVTRSFMMIPAPWIGGRLLDSETGKPAAGMRVDPLTEDYGMGARRFIRTTPAFSVSKADGE